VSEINELRESLKKAGEHSASTEEAVERIIGVYEHSKSLKSALDEIEKEAKLMLTDIIAETGKDDWKTESGRCYITKPGRSVKWDRKGLDNLMLTEPELATKLGKYRSETERPGVLTIRASK
jgi:predicted nuclease with TOPRIM domain